MSQALGLVAQELLEQSPPFEKHPSNSELPTLEKLDVMPAPPLAPLALKQSLNQDQGPRPYTPAPKPADLDHQAEKEVLSAQEVSQDSLPAKESLPPLPQEVSVPVMDQEIPEVASHQEQQDSVEFSQERDEELHLPPQAKKSKFKIIALLFLVLTSSLVASGVYFFLFQGPKVEAFFEVKSWPMDLQSRLAQNARQTQSPVVKMSFVQGPRGELAASVNRHGPALVTLSLQSVDKKLLGEGRVAGEYKGTLRDQVLVIEKMPLREGQQLIPGQYSVDVRFTPSGKVNNFLTALKRTELFNFVKVIREASEPFSYQGLFILGLDNPQEFETKLNDYYQKKKEKILWPLQERLERFSTIQGVLSQLLNSYKEQMGKIKRGAQIRGFEKNYAMKMAPILQEIIVEASKKMNAPSESKVETLSNWEDLLNFGKDVAKMASDMAWITKQNKVLSRAKRQGLIDTFSQSARELSLNGQKFTKDLQTQIELAQQQL